MTRDTHLQVWTQDFQAVANANPGQLGLIAGDVNPVSTDKTSFDTSITNYNTIQAEAKAATQQNNTLRKKIETKTRVLVRKIQANQAFTPALKSQLGLNIPDPSPSPSNPFPPTELSAAVVAAGLCNLKWNRNANPQGTIFLIESSINPDTGWHIIGTTTKTTYEKICHTPQVLHNGLFRNIGTYKSDEQRIILILDKPILFNPKIISLYILLGFLK